MRKPRPKFVLMGIGSRGDTNALLWLAAELVKRGHRCLLLGTEPLQQPAAASGVPLTVVAPAQSNNLVPPAEAFRDYALQTYEPTFRLIRQELDAGEDLVVITRTGPSPAAQCCERYGLPQVRTYIAPSQMRSFVDPPWPLKRMAKGRLRNAFLDYHLPKLYEEWEHYPGILHPLNEQRRKLGLSPLESTAPLDRYVDRFIGFFPDWFSPPAPDWHPIDLVGFPVPNEGGSLPPSFEHLVRTRGRPLVFTPGTGVAHVADFFRTAAECCRRLQLPGVFLSPHHVPHPQDVAQDLLHFEFLPMQPVLAHAALLVHHGGVGTTARALQARVPQVVIPQAYDQPDNGACVAALGVGAVLDPACVTPDSLAERIGELCRDRVIPARLEVIASRMDGDEPIRRAADLLERSYVSGCGAAGGSIS